MDMLLPDVEDQRAKTQVAPEAEFALEIATFQHGPGTSLYDSLRLGLIVDVLHLVIFTLVIHY